MAQAGAGAGMSDKASFPFRASSDITDLYRRERDEAWRELARARAVLRSVEWVYQGSNRGVLCPICDASEPTHAKDCDLVRAMGGQR